MTNHETAARFRRRAEIEAVQWTGSNTDAMSVFCSPFDFQTIDPEDRVEDPDRTAAVRTHPHGGWVGLKPGDWVVREAGRYTTASDEEFRAAWEPAPAAVSVPPPAPQAADRRARYAAAIAEGFRAFDADTTSDAYLDAELLDAVVAVADAEEAVTRADALAAAFREAAEAVAALDRRKIGIVADTIKDAWEEGRDEAADLLRRLADEAAVSGPCVAGEQQNETPEAEAHPPHHRWMVETRDDLAEEWAPGMRFTDRAEAVARYQTVSELYPEWRDGTPVQRRFVRETTSYTVEAPE